MAVELRRTRQDLFLCSSQLSDNQNDVVEDADRCVSDNYTDELTASSGSQSETETSDDDKLTELTRQMAAQFTSDQDLGPRLSTTEVASPTDSGYGSSEEGLSNETTPVIEKQHNLPDSHGITASMEKMKIGDHNYPPLTKDRSRINQQIRAVQLYKLKQELSWRDLREKTSPNGSERAQQVRNWPNHRLHVSRSGMRAVFLDGSGSKAQPGPSAGTGVFLPAMVGEASHSHKKKGCSPVLIPAKVMEALKIHFDRMANVSPHNAPLQLQHDNGASKPNGILRPEKKRQPRAAPVTVQNDIGLPQDWTY